MKQKLFKIALIIPGVLVLAIVVCLIVVLKAKYDTRKYVERVYGANSLVETNKISFVLEKDIELMGFCDIIPVKLQYCLHFRYGLVDSNKQKFYVDSYWPLQPSQKVIAERSGYEE